MIHSQNSIQNQILIRKKIPFFCSTQRPPNHTTPRPQQQKPLSDPCFDSLPLSPPFPSPSISPFFRHLVTSSSKQGVGTAALNFSASRHAEARNVDTCLRPRRRSHEHTAATGAQGAFGIGLCGHFSLKSRRLSRRYSSPSSNFFPSLYYILG